MFVCGREGFVWCGGLGSVWGNAWGGAVLWVSGGRGAGSRMPWKVTALQGVFV